MLAGTVSKTLHRLLELKPPKNVLRVVLRRRWRVSERAGRGGSWQHGNSPKTQTGKKKNHINLHTLSHRGSQLTSQCFNPSSLQNKGATAIGGRGPIYTLASNRLLAAQRNLQLYKQTETGCRTSSPLRTRCPPPRRPWREDHHSQTPAVPPRASLKPGVRKCIP